MTESKPAGRLRGAKSPSYVRAVGTPESRAKVEALVKESGAQLWIGHDIVGFARLKKSPAFYE